MPATPSPVELDEPRADEVLVRMTAAGLCHTDLGVASGGLPFPLPGVLGHEGAGVVEQVGPAVTSVGPGDHVLLSFTSCGHCGNCHGGHPAYCATWLPDNLLGGVRRDGSATITRGGEPLGGRFFGQSSFSRMAVADERSVVKVDPSASLETIAPLGCGVQTGVGAVWNVLEPRPGSTVVVAGAGAVGLSAVMAAALTPALQIVAVDVVPARLDLARKLGATHVVDASKEDYPTRIAEITGGVGAHGVIETTGNVQVLRHAVDSLTARGTAVVVGAPPFGTEVSLDVNGMLGGKTVTGLTLGDSETQTFIPLLAAMAADGRLPIGELVTTYAFADIEQAVADVRRGVTIKPVLTFD
jgi:aryl-alcohol dehydrogenase